MSKFFAALLVVLLLAFGARAEEQVLYFQGYVYNNTVNPTVVVGTGVNVTATYWDLATDSWQERSIITSSSQNNGYYKGVDTSIPFSYVLVSVSVTASERGWTTDTAGSYDSCSGCLVTCSDMYCHWSGLPGGGQ